MNTRIIKMIVTVMSLIIAILILAAVILYYWSSSSSLGKEKLAEIKVFFNPAAVSQDENETFIVMTYNIGYLSGMNNNLPIKTTKVIFEKNMQTALQLLEDVKPDFIGFQEIDFHSHRSYYMDQLQTIAENAGYKYAASAINWDKHYVPFPYWPPSVHFGNMLSGQAVLSRWPILSAQRIVLDKPENNPFYYNAFYLDRLVQVVKIKIKEKNIILLNIHLDASDCQTRKKQARKVLEIYHSFNDNYPVLIIGDFNCVPPDAPQKKDFIDEPDTDFTGEETIELFLSEKSLSEAEPVTFTFPSNAPTRKLDFIFYNHDKISYVRSWVLNRINSSDHLPLVMKFSLKF